MTIALADASITRLGAITRSTFCIAKSPAKSRSPHSFSCRVLHSSTSYSSPSRVFSQITLSQKRSFEPHAIGLYVARNSSQSRLLLLSADNLVGKTSFEKRKEARCVLTLLGCQVLLSPSSPQPRFPIPFHLSRARTRTSLFPRRFTRTKVARSWCPPSISSDISRPRVIQFTLNVHLVSIVGERVFYFSPFP